MTVAADVCSIVATGLTVLYFAFTVHRTREIVLGGCEAPASAFIPILATYICSVLWFKYGFILGDLAMTIVNGLGMVLALYSVFVYHQHSPHRAFCEYLTICGLIGILAWLQGISWGFVKLDGIGYSAMTASVLMYAAPLSATLTIVKTAISGSKPTPQQEQRKRSNIWLPREGGLALSMILISFAVSLSWCLYGFLIVDRFVIIPNGLGALMSLLQFSVWSFSYPTAGTFVTKTNLVHSSLADSQGSLRDPLVKGNAIAPIEMKAL